MKVVQRAPRVGLVMHDARFGIVDCIDFSLEWLQIYVQSPSPTHSAYWKASQFGNDPTAVREIKSLKMPKSLFAIRGALQSMG